VLDAKLRSYAMTSLDVIRAIIAALKSDDPIDLETAAQQLDVYIAGAPEPGTLTLISAEKSPYVMPVQRIVLNAPEIIATTPIVIAKVEAAVLGQ
jgi:hypothetical protein